MVAGRDGDGSQFAARPRGPRWGREDGTVRSIVRGAPQAVTLPMLGQRMRIQVSS